MGISPYLVVGLLQVGSAREFIERVDWTMIRLPQGFPGFALPLLELRHFCMSSNTLKTFKRACPALTTLILELERFLDEAEDFDVSTLPDVLSSTKAILERSSLKLSLAEFFYDSEEFEPVDPVDLTDYRRVKDIRLGLPFISGRTRLDDYTSQPMPDEGQKEEEYVESLDIHELLPSSIRTLRLPYLSSREDPRHIADLISHLLDQTSTRLRSLSEIKVKVSGHHIFLDHNALMDKGLMETFTALRERWGTLALPSSRVILTRLSVRGSSRV